MPNSLDGDIGYAAVIVLSGSYVFYKGFQDLKAERIFIGTPLSKARSAAVGPVKLAGRARAFSPTLVDPIYGRPCCYFDVTVSQLVSFEGARGSRLAWEVVSVDTSPLPFYLQDETGSILIERSGAKLELKKAVEWPPRFWGAGAKCPELAYARRKCSVGRTKVDAYIVRDGQPLFVYGYASRDKRSGERKVSQGNEGPFVISDESQAALVFNMGWSSALRVFGGPLLALAGLVYLAFASGLLR